MRRARPPRPHAGDTYQVMDKYNTFHTRVTYALVRLDWAVIMFITFALIVLNWREVNWWRFTIAFLLPDLIGTLPGLYVYYGLRSGPRRSISIAARRTSSRPRSWAARA